MEIKKNVNRGISSWSETKFSKVNMRIMEKLNIYHE